ncbi:uncharacterized protein FIBRA_01186 [Fibroporia radiculosa]|uniref:Uncharacterized protein n=1 Tax=Fibroporia radiculosa TaxID=599839 RepID=J4I8C5_9APHY|nr:uncharacterized protein FIBRA_01186 [Fibroporia radiculosa]CCL99171.1 predicted protein [Fibroporia radiculosa]
MERDLELERRKSAGLQDSLKERDKEYQKLKTQYDKIKRKALLAPNLVGSGEGAIPLSGNENPHGERPIFNEQSNKLKSGMAFGATVGGAVNVGAVVGDMEAHGIQRTPIVNRTAMQPGTSWRQPASAQPRHNPQRQPFNTGVERSFRSHTTQSDRTDSVGEVENLIGAANVRQSARPANNNAWPAQARMGRPQQRGETPYPRVTPNAFSCQYA